MKTGCYLENKLDGNLFSSRNQGNSTIHQIGRDKSAPITIIVIKYFKYLIERISEIWPEDEKSRLQIKNLEIRKT